MNIAQSPNTQLRIDLTPEREYIHEYVQFWPQIFAAVQPCHSPKRRLEVLSHFLYSSHIVERETNIFKMSMTTHPPTHDRIMKEMKDPPPNQ